jgi:hypothetical protein
MDIATIRINGMKLAAPRYGIGGRWALILRKLLAFIVWLSGQWKNIKVLIVPLKIQKPHGGAAPA